MAAKKAARVMGRDKIDGIEQSDRYASSEGDGVARGAMGGWRGLEEGREEEEAAA